MDPKLGKGRDKPRLLQQCRQGSDGLPELGNGSERPRLLRHSRQGSDGIQRAQEWQGETLAAPLASALSSEQWLWGEPG